ncbi:uncharacterized protein RCC_01680 [Ramularia collo-cygni]|uniref:Uncharacterized protein n=1 Tax=Ramularia collo-cygni TaxID=112498 RepID=A0A2D3V053_9PEZI|nr:uncharacterized protein RCC_01680 [Ramularia collo-cygni]CZT15844.1 uncharacterized protein RCC_01680 [Ramularia collo-cygni]
MGEEMGKAWKGQGGGIQGAATAVGDMVAEETKSSGQKKGDAANLSLNEFSKGTKRSGDTVQGTGIDAGKQVENQESGSADHLGMGMRKAA